MLVQVTTKHGKPFRRAGKVFGPTPTRLWVDEGNGQPPDRRTPVISPADLARLEQATGERGPLIIERDAPHLRSADAEADLTAAQARADDLAAERDRLVAERDQLAAERDRLAAERDRLATERDRLVAMRDDLAAERDDLAAKVAGLDARLAEERQRAENLAATLERAQERIRQLEDDARDNRQGRGRRG